MKKFIATFISFMMLLVFIPTAPVLANESKKGMEIHNFKDIATLPKEKTYTYEEVLKDMELNGLATPERVANFKAQHALNTQLAGATSYIGYSRFTMNSYSFWSGWYKYVLRPIFYVGLEYSGSSSPDRMVSLEQPSILTDEGHPCVFGGNIFYRLESGNSFYYGVSGDVYSPCTTTITGGGQIGVGESSNISWSVSNTSNYIKNINFEGRYYSEALNP